VTLELGISERVLAGIICSLALLSCPEAARGQTPPPLVSVEIEGGAFGFTRNDVRDPGDIGTPFTFRSLNAVGPTACFRVYVEISPSPRHTFRVLVAPLEVSGTGALDRSTFFETSTFAPAVPTKGIYKFNNYRVNWRYTLRDRERWKLQLGAGVLVRDAKIELQQGALQVADTDVGVVPVAAFTARYRASPRTHLVFDFEGLGAKQGRALDGSLKVVHDLTPHVQIGAGYRALEGGVDVKSIYNFAFIHYAVASIGYWF
jgi:hypothetical protein